MFASKFSRALKYSIFGGVAGTTLFSLHSNQYEPNSIGIVRLSRAAVTVFKIGVIYKTGLYGTDLDKESDEYKAIKSECHKKSAQKLLRLCCINKGVYIKVGQHIAALDYLLPTEYVQTMKVLHSNAPTNSIEDLFRVIREDLKREPTEMFVKFDYQPIGTASLAQVHKATLTDGSVVAVKVQHPYVQGNSNVDLKTMEVLVKIMGWVFPEFKFQWLVNETKRNIPIELDFIQEGQNAEKVTSMFSNYNWLRVPKVRWDLTTSRVLTMEFVEGGQVNDLEYIQKNDINPFEVSDKLGRLYSQMIFIHGFVHSDPHPGNILVKKSSRGDCDIILLDHGLYSELKDEFRVEYANLWLSILDRDRKAMRLHSENLGIEGKLYGLFACMVTGRTWESVLQGVDKHQATAGEKDIFQEHFPSVLPQISSILDRVNRQMLLVLKTNDLIRGIEYTLKTSARMGAFKVMSQCCVQSVYSQKMSKATSKFAQIKIKFAECWLLFKLNVYYTCVNLRRLISLQFTGT